MDGILNKDVINIYIKKNETEAFAFVLKYLEDLNNNLYSEIPSTIKSAVKSCYTKYRLLSKSKSTPHGLAKWNVFMDTLFLLPKVKLSNPNTTCVTPSSGSFLNTEVVNLKKVASDLATELAKEKSNNSVIVEDLKEKLSKSNLKQVTKELDKTKKQLQLKNEEIKRLRSQSKYYENKSAKLKLETIDSDSKCQVSISQYNELCNDFKKLTNEHSEILISCEWMESLLNDQNVIELYDDESKTYTTDCRMCVYELLNDNVSVSKMGDVIQCVLKLAGKTPNRVPSKSTIIEMNIQRLSLSQRHIGDVLAQDSTTCLLTDETSRRGEKYMGYEVSDSGGNLWVLGLRDIKTKSAADTLSVFKEILSDIDLVSNTSTNDKSKLLMKHIVATMSDRAATEVKFNALLQEYKENIAPLIIDNFIDLSEDEKGAIVKLLNYFCGLHTLIHMAETAQKGLLEGEKGIFADSTVPVPDPQFANVLEPGTIRLIRTASKAFAAGADEKSGVFGHFSVYSREFLKTHKLHSLPLAQFRGARFNILFSNGASVYFLNEQMLKFLQEYGAENRLLKAVLKDLEVPEFIAGTKALGLICYLVTCPFWSIMENKAINIVDMNKYFTQLIEFCEKVNENLPEFLKGKFLAFEDSYVKDDCILKSLLTPTEHDATVMTYLAIIFPALGLLCRHLFKDHPDVDTNDPSIRNKLKCVPKTNKYSESVFGMLDFILKQKPNVSTIASEAYIMFAQNKTLQWLSSKEKAERDNILREARRNSKLLQKQFKVRRQDIVDSRRAAIQNKIREKEAAKIRKFEAMAGYTRAMIDFGLWQQTDQVDNQLKLLTKNTEKYAALKAQLQFRQHVLKQIAAKEFFVLTKTVGKKKGVKKTVNEMTICVKHLITTASQNMTSEGVNHLVGRRVSHKFLNDREDAWFIGTVISQVCKCLTIVVSCLYFGYLI